MSLYKVVPMTLTFGFGIGNVVSVEGLDNANTGEKRIRVTSERGESLVFDVKRYEVGPDPDLLRAEGRVHVEFLEHNGRGTALWPESEYLRDRKAEPKSAPAKKERAICPPPENPTKTPCYLESVEYLAGCIKAGKLPSKADPNYPEVCQMCALWQLLNPEGLKDSLSAALKKK